VPDLRGRVAAGLDNLNGTAAGRIGTVATDSGTIVGTTVGSTGGSAAHAQTTAELAQHAHTDSGHSHSIPNVVTTGSLPVGNGGTTQMVISEPTTVTSNNGAANIQNAGSSSAMAWLQPTIMMGKILRVI
jgi:microcystin-dependent protein